MQAAPDVFWRLAALSLINGAGPPALLWFGKVVIDYVAVTAPRAASLASWLTDTPAPVIGALVGVVLLNVVLDGVDTVSSFYLSTLRDRVAIDVQTRLLTKTSGFASIGVFENPHLLNLLVLADNAISQLQYLVVVLSNWMQGLFVMVPTIVLSATIAWWVPLLLFLTSLPSVHFQFLYERRQWSEEASQATKVRTMRAHEEILIRPAFAKDLRMYGLADYFLGRWKRLYADRFAALQAIRRHGTGMTLLWSLVSGMSAGLPYLFVVFQAIRGQLTLGDVALFAGLSFQVRRSLYSFFAHLRDLKRIAHAADALFEVFDYDEMERAENQVTLANGTEPSGTMLNRLPTVAMMDVSFTYPGAGTPALQRINLRIDAGETVVIVGENGAGKTTLAKLLCRLYAPSEGRILLDDRDYRLINLDDFRHEVAVVFQDFAHFPATLRENIGVGNLSELDNDEMVRQTASQLALTALIATLPGQLDTVLSKEIEDGIELSGGQWQRIAIARALMRKDARLVIFDEPTAALDPRMEFEVLNLLRQWARTKTTVIISHRLALARIATTVIVMAQGEIVERGTHEALMEMRGQYFEMFTRQASSYV